MRIFGISPIKPQAYLCLSVFLASSLILMFPGSQWEWFLSHAGLIALGYDNCQRKVLVDEDVIGNGGFAAPA